MGTAWLSCNRMGPRLSHRLQRIAPEWEGNIARILGARDPLTS